MSARLSVLFAATLLAVFATPTAFAAKPEPPGLETADDGSATTPMSRMSTNAVDARLRGKGNKQTSGGKLCKDLAGEGKRPGKRSKDAEECEVPGIEITKDNSNGDCPDCGARNSSDGRKKTIKNKITVTYQKPGDRKDGATRWPDTKFKPQQDLPVADIQNGPPNPDKLTDPVTVSFTPNGRTDKPPVGPLACDTFHPDGAADAESDGTCDMKKLFVKYANKKAEAAVAPPGKEKKKKKAFHADADGNCLETSEDAATKCGEERRVQKITETFEIECDPGYSLVNGQCRSNTPGAMLAKALAVEPTPGVGADGGSMMMGFTFAPPRAKWGLDYSEEACIDLLFDEFCFTVFSVFIGYDIDVAAGLRLPVDFAIDGIPLPKAIAGRTVGITPKMTPADFSAAEYRTFCQNENMADGWIIANCDRFSFPEFFSSKLKEAVDAIPAGLPRPNVELDGKEMVAQAILKAGVFVEVLGVSVVNIGINAGNDFSTACTMSKIQGAILDGKIPGNMVSLMTGAWNDPLSIFDLLSYLKNNGLNCSSFTTPFGAGETFPFLPEAGMHLPADCDKQDIKTVTVKGKKIPMCTGMALKYGPASLGLGITVKVTVDSDLMKADWNAGGDARPGPGYTGKTQWTKPGSSIVNPTLPVTFDNHESFPTSGNISIDNLTYCINGLTIALSANLEFGGILGFLPDLAEIPVYSLRLGIPGCGIPIPQHNATGPLNIPVPVENYALRVSTTPVATTANPIIDDNGVQRLLVIPGNAGTFRVNVDNLGTTVADFDNLRRTLPASVSPTPAPGGWTTTPDAAGFNAILIGDVASGGTGQATIDVTPFRHPRTTPGGYDLPVRVDSKQAKALNMAAADPLSLRRTDAEALIRIYAKAFREPKIGILPLATSGKPGAPASTFTVNLQNFGNEPDAIALSHVFVNWNAAGCGLPTLGGTGCPFRGVPTLVQGPWSSIGAMPTLVPAAPGKLAPEQETQTSFTLGIPSDWAGMRDTTYQVTVTATSTGDPECAFGSTTCTPAHMRATISHTVIATKQSMTRYIGLELEELAQKIRDANAAGVSSGGALPIVTRDVQGAHGRAMDAILAGDLGKASNTLSTMIKGMEAFQKAMAKQAEPYFSDWMARSNAILADLAAAEASMVTSN